MRRERGNEVTGRGKTTPRGERRHTPTWIYEGAVVAGLLFGTAALATPGRVVDYLAACAVLASFCHAQIADRLGEAEAKRGSAATGRTWGRRYLVAKEGLWVATFLASGLYPSLVGSAIFLAYPLWRGWWGRRRAVRAAGTGGLSEATWNLHGPASGRLSSMANFTRQGPPNRAR
jgi:hypothetical protein